MPGMAWQATGQEKVTEMPGASKLEEHKDGELKNPTALPLQAKIGMESILYRGYGYLPPKTKPTQEKIERKQ